MDAITSQISLYLKQYGISNNMAVIGGAIFVVGMSVLSSFFGKASNSVDKNNAKGNNNAHKNDAKISNEQYNANLTALLAAEDSKKNKNKKNKNKNKKKQHGSQAAFVSSLSAQDLGDDGDVEDSDDEDTFIKSPSHKKDKKKGKKLSGEEKVIVKKEEKVVVEKVVDKKIVEETTNDNVTTNDKKKKKKKKNKNDYTKTAAVAAADSTPISTPVVPEISVNAGGNARETNSERAARLERMKARSIGADVKKDVPSSSGKSNSDSNTSNTSNQVVVEDEGWSIAGDRSKKQKVVEKENVKDVVSSAVVSDPSDAAVSNGTSIDDGNVKTEEDATSSTPVVVATPPAPPAPPAPVEVTKTVTVDSRKVGRIIGPKGKTMKEIMAVTNVKIDIPRIEDKTISSKNSNTVDVTVVGSKNGTKKAISAIEELCAKGYAKLIAEEGFQESTITVSPSTQQELVSSGGKCLQALQTQCGVKLNLNLNDNGKKDSNSSNNSSRRESTKLVIAGSKEGVEMCKDVLKAIAKVFHHEMTHPGMIHTEVDVPEHMYKIIIGKKGNEIKHIQANFKVHVHIPQTNANIVEGEERPTQVLVVGQPNGVQGAVRYIEKIVEKAVAREQGIDDIVDGENGNNVVSSSVPPPTSEEDAPPEWMDRFDYAKLRAREDEKFLAAAKELTEQEQRTGTQAPIQSQNTSPNQAGTDSINGIGTGSMPTPQEAWGLVGTTF